jgi:hypothetical protein
MWPWSKKPKSIVEKQINETIKPPEPKVQQATPAVASISHDKLKDAILLLRGDGFHFGMSYAQMNGYNEQLTNPARFSELITLVCSDPEFTELGIDFAVKCQLGELDYSAQHPNGLSYSIPNFQTDSMLRQKEEENSKRWARELLARVREVGGNNLSRGFDRIGFNFREFLINTVIERRASDLGLFYTEIERRKDALRPLFLRAYARGRNKYGEIECGPLNKEINDFFERFFPKGTLKFFFLAPPVVNAMAIALAWVEEAQVDDILPNDGHDYEHWCSRKIEEQGWSVVVTKASGDQGVDVIASRDSITVAVQCKRYTTPIGNKAVQEAFSGAKHYNADVAAVIGTGGFTASAQDLARATNVILLDAEMIGDFTTQVLNKL